MYNEDIPVELLTQRLCDMKQGYTQFGGIRFLSQTVLRFWFLCLWIGLRPFGVSLLYAGYDPHYKFQLYHSDPSGNYSGWKATCIGANNGTAQSLLKQEYKDDITVKDAIGLVLRTMSKTMDSTTLGSEKRECSQSFFFMSLFLIVKRLSHSWVCCADSGCWDEPTKSEDIQAFRYWCLARSWGSDKERWRHRDEIDVGGRRLCAVTLQM